MSCVQLHQVGVHFLNKCCFKAFTGQVGSHDSIALVGENGSGKSLLLSIIAGDVLPSEGKVTHGRSLRVARLFQELIFPPQATVMEVAGGEVLAQLARLETICDPDHYDVLMEQLLACDAFNLEARLEALLVQSGLNPEAHVATLSGGQQMLLGLTQLLALDPDVLLLDEPTNHLDQVNRKRLLTMLASRKKACVVATHDLDLLEAWPRTIWEIEHKEIGVYHSGYKEFLEERQIQLQRRIEQREQLLSERKKLGKAYDFEQQRMHRSKRYGRLHKSDDKMTRNALVERAENTHGRKRKEIVDRKAQIEDELKALRQERSLTPHFGMKAAGKVSVDVRDGACGYGNQMICHGLNFSIQEPDRIGLTGSNGSGKTTLLKALSGDSGVQLQGEWSFSANIQEKMGYLDQHYSLLDPDKTTHEMLREKCPEWTPEQVCRHLKSYLFFREQPTRQLSGGEKLRLCLSLIAAKPPALLLLDEVTNNIDLKTKEHLVTVLKAYPGAIVISSHEKAFLDLVGTTCDIVCQPK